MYCGYYEEGDFCPACKGGKIDWPQIENCSCFLDPPCVECTERRLTCSSCGWEDERPDYKNVPCCPGIAVREYAPRPLDSSKIDYRTKGHTSGSMIKEGVYPENVSRKEVEEVVRGTFGGQFLYFGKGRFKYIAYTD